MVYYSLLISVKLTPYSTGIPLAYNYSLINLSDDSQCYTNLSLALRILKVVSGDYLAFDYYQSYIYLVKKNEYDSTSPANGYGGIQKYAAPLL